MWRTSCPDSVNAETAAGWAGHSQPLKRRGISSGCPIPSHMPCWYILQGLRLAHVGSGKRYIGARAAIRPNSQYSRQLKILAAPTAWRMAP